MTASVLQEQLDALRSQPAAGAPAPQQPGSPKAAASPTAAAQQQGFKKTFYKRKLPSPPAIEFSGPEGAAVSLNSQPASPCQRCLNRIRLRDLLPLQHTIVQRD